MRRGRKFAVTMVSLAVLLLAAAVISVSVGSTSAGIGDALRRMLGSKVPAEVAAVVDLRLSRVALAAVVGAALAAAGAALQALLRNPLADPYILGVSGGGALGAAAFMTLGAATRGFFDFVEVLGFSGRAAAALLGALAASAAVLGAGRRRGHIMPTTLLLVGVMVNAICGAAVLAMTYLADPARSHQIVVWLMGNLDAVALPVSAIAGAGAAVLVLSALLWRLGGRLNVLSLGDEEALHLGVNVPATRLEVFALGALVTGLSVALAGPIGFVGLVVPHITRIAVGADHRFLFPAVVLAGAAFLVLADTAARALSPGNPLPVGVLTAALGGPFFIWLLRAARGRYFE